MDNKTFYCYKITNIINSKIYIGITSDIKKRWRDHKSYGRNITGKKHYKSPLYMAMNKYSEDSFTFEIISSKSSLKSICKDEIRYIKSYKSFNGHGYNLTAGGDGGIGQKVSDKTKHKLRKISRLQMSNPKNRELSRQGALNQWNNISDKELDERTERMRQVALKLHKDKAYRDKLKKACFKSVMGNGIKYKSVNDCAKSNGVAANTITYRCQNIKNKDFYYINTGVNNG